MTLQDFVNYVVIGWVASIAIGVIARLIDRATNERRPWCATCNAWHDQCRPGVRR